MCLKGGTVVTQSLCRRVVPEAALWQCPALLTHEELSTSLTWTVTPATMPAPLMPRANSPIYYSSRNLRESCKVSRGNMAWCLSINLGLLAFALYFLFVFDSNMKYTHTDVVVRRVLKKKLSYAADYVNWISSLVELTFHTNRHTIHLVTIFIYCWLNKRNRRFAILYPGHLII